MRCSPCATRTEQTANSDTVGGARPSGRRNEQRSAGPKILVGHVSLGIDFHRRGWAGVVLPWTLPGRRRALAFAQEYARRAVLVRGSLARLRPCRRMRSARSCWRPRSFANSRFADRRRRGARSQLGAGLASRRCGLDRFADRSLDREVHVHARDACEAVHVRSDLALVDDLVAGVLHEREVLANLLIT
jgi:hypothetical protein